MIAVGVAAVEAEVGVVVVAAEEVGEVVVEAIAETKKTRANPTRLQRPVKSRQARSANALLNPMADPIQECEGRPFRSFRAQRK